MIAFRDPEIGDRQWVEERFRASGNQGCEYSFSTLFLWSGAYQQQVASMDGFVLERLRGKLGAGYLFPAGSGPLEPVLSALEKDAAERGEPCRFFCVTPEQAERLEQLRPGQYAFQSDRDGWDYLYALDRLAGLGGKKLHGKRNHIRRFEESHPDWQVEQITMDNLAECAEMDLEWNRRYRSLDAAGEEAEARTRLDERHAMSRAFAHYEALGMDGLLLRTGGKVVAFTMGSPISADTFDVHFEKAYGEIQGAYPMINREFARWLQANRPGVRWLNREDDMGLEGLRKSKESYYPDRMVEKSAAIRRD
ncbi:phosphatidylglycerol lysyltransferase domain-containing protein [Flavonifractor sp. An10]|uniref:DUF2156 domain-containing protein n=1 Tax=Flavonifractor sp. An10 TaxID=1965537 RepID=UPI000B36986E|nr:phosphatidylglycerol lysyltransferase domain-containing protein [Flavonifractor sp. An10]OUQ79987.1 hypothetical protein B5E42_15555 [Flavonifractor sp. An10]